MSQDFFVSSWLYAQRKPQCLPSNLKFQACNLGANMTIMKEGRLIFPRGGSGAALDAIMSRIVHEFGGCTRYFGVGDWMAPAGGRITEPVTIVDIAYEQTDAMHLALFNIARDFMHECKQLSAYVRYGNGVVEIISPDNLVPGFIVDKACICDWDRPDTSMHALDCPESKMGGAA
jgi:hypothetical protein